MNIEIWIKDFAARIEKAFPGRVELVGLQGSYARGEAGKDSDIDVVVILNHLAPEDLHTYRGAVADLPFRQRLCGFVSGKDVLAKWDRGELFQFIFDTRIVKGDFSWLALPDKADARRALKAGACAVYHGACHNALHAGSEEALRALCKAALFAMRARVYLESGKFVQKTEELLRFLTKEETEIARIAKEGLLGKDFMEYSGVLLSWAGRMIAAAEEA